MADTTHADPFDLTSVHTGLLDCVQVNLAVLADHHHGPEAHLRLGASLDFKVHTPPDGQLPTVDVPLTDHLDALPATVGLRLTGRERLSPAAMLAAARARGGTSYLVADSFHLPWLPYHGQVHMEHSFLLTPRPDGWCVTDAYRSETTWGTAEPGHWTLADDDFAGIGTAEGIGLEAADFAPAAALPPTHTADPATVDAYLAAYDNCPDRPRAVQQLTVETWLLARARKLHARYRERQYGSEEQGPVGDHLRTWDKIVEQTYLAHRRVSRGRAEPPGLVDRLREALDADRTVFAAVATATPDGGPVAPDASDTPGDALRQRVAAVAGAVLGVEAAALIGGAAFDSFAAFSSFRLIEIIERLENELGREFDADDLVPENLRRVDDLCRIAR